jgi:hypothetical protein
MDRLPALRAFERILLLVVGFEAWLRAIPKWGQLSGAYDVHLGVVSVACLIGVATPWRRSALAVVAMSQGYIAWREFPSTGNHAYLEVALCALGATLRVEDDADRALYLRGVRWLVLVVFFWSGVQKLAHGYWTHGEYLAFSLDTAGFRPVLAWLVDADELRRLAAFDGQVGDGPYTTSSWRLLAVSNGTWIVETLLPAFLVWRRTRIAAALAGLALLAGIEIGAREVFFGLIFANAIVTFLPATVQPRLVAPVAATLVVLTLSRLAFVAVWPLAQMALVAHYDVSPWKLGGWGMYSTPRFHLVGMEVYGRAGDVEVEMTAPGPAVRAAAGEYLERYRWLRALASRDALVDAIFAEEPTWTSLRLVVSRPDMDARTGMIVMTHAEYAHPRR